MLRAIMADAERLSSRHRRVALEQLPRDRLAELTARYELEVEDRRAASSHIDAIIRSRKVVFGEVLAGLKREELKEICRALGIDDSGKEKDAIVERILSLGNGASEAQEAARAPAAGSAPEPLSLSPSPQLKEKKRRPASTGHRASMGGETVGDYRHDATRVNNPPAGLVEFDRPPPQPTKSYAYDPHLDPTLQWAGKAERTSFDVDTVSLHIHERVSTQAILRAVKREEAQRSLFADFDLPESKIIDFYHHEVGWANRLVLGDSLLVMNSLLEREHMAGKVQCVFMDPPYGVKFNSNFQPSVSRRDVKDGDDASLTREPEQIQAYRDTWTLGIHSYLAYMRDRLLLARDLLAESGSAFVQISDENVHHVREVMDEVFGADNFLSQIAFVKTSAQTSNFIPSTADYLLWYARSHEHVKFRELFAPKVVGGRAGGQYTWIEEPSGKRRKMSDAEWAGDIRPGFRVFRPDNLTSARQGRVYGASGVFPVKHEGREFLPGGGQSWKTNETGAARLVAARRVHALGNTLCYVRYLDDFPVSGFSSVWDDTGNSGFGDARVYVVQTNTRVAARCLLMTTDPGDLVFDPTCGSGTTAFVAEQWGRRWITCDTSRVALTLARQRLLTAKFPFYCLRAQQVRDGFVYRTVPHITLKSIAQNPKLDECKTQADCERVIRESADQEVLYDQPEIDGGRVRVTGPFTVEAIPVASLEDPTDASTAAAAPAPSPSSAGSDYLGMMLDLLRRTGVQFAKTGNLPLPNLRPVKGPYEWLHAETEIGSNGGTKRVAVSFGPRHAPVTPVQVLGGIQETRGYDLVLFVGFACDPEARRVIDAGVHGRELHFAHAAPDILVGDLLKTSKATRLFTVFGAPDVEVHDEPEGLLSVELVEVNLYDPNTGETTRSKGEEVAAWFVDHDYDGRTFCVSQALFPSAGSRDPWEKLQKALKGTIDEDKFAQLRTTRSLPFKAGKKIAIKVIDDRGNEVIKIVDPKAGRSRKKGA